MIGGGISAAPAAADDSATLTISASGRSVTNGAFTVAGAITVSASYYLSTCGNGLGCKAWLEATYLDASTGAFGSSSTNFSGGQTAAITFSSTLQSKIVTALRAHVSPTGLSGSAAYSAWVPVADPGVTPQLTLSVNSFSRPATSGNASYSIVLSASGYMNLNGPCVSTSNCWLELDGLYASDGLWHVLPSGQSSFTTSTYPASHTYASPTSWVPPLLAVRGRLFGASTYTPVVTEPTQVDDWNPVPWVGAKLTTLTPNANGSLTFDTDLSAMNLRIPGSEGCAGAGYIWGCYGYLDAQLNDGSVVTLSSVQLTATNAPQTKHLAGTSATLPSPITGVRVRTAGSGGGDFSLVGPWVPVTGAVAGGYDTDKALALITAAMVGRSNLEICATLFEVGTHQLGSSVSDPRA
jgi:hypothetical protein